jgi:hypothetical protein
MVSVSTQTVSGIVVANSSITKSALTSLAQLQGSLSLKSNAGFSFLQAQTKRSNIANSDSMGIGLWKVFIAKQFWDF